MRGIIVATILVALATIAPLAALSGEPVCCACLAPSTNATAGTAVFCSSLPGKVDIRERCEDATGGAGGLVCIADGLNQSASEPSCRSLLAAKGVTCPTSGAPAATPLNLAALAVTLGAAGIAVLRRRQRQA